MSFWVGTCSRKLLEPAAWHWGYRLGMAGNGVIRGGITGDTSTESPHPSQEAQGWSPSIPQMPEPRSKETFELLSVPKRAPRGLERVMGLE